MPTGLFESKKGISNLVATLILIAVAVVGGAFAYSAFKEQATSITTTAAVQVQDLDAVSVGNGTVYLSTTVKNTGTQRLLGLTVTVDPGGVNKALDVGNLSPGETGSASGNSSGLTAGKSYAVRITADTPADADSNPNLTKTMTVRVRR